MLASAPLALITTSSVFAPIPVHLLRQDSFPALVARSLPLDSHLSDSEDEARSVDGKPESCS